MVRFAHLMLLFVPKKLLVGLANLPTASSKSGNIKKLFWTTLGCYSLEKSRDCESI